MYNSAELVTDTVEQAELALWKIKNENPLQEVPPDFKWLQEKVWKLSAEYEKLKHTLAYKANNFAVLSHSVSNQMYAKNHRYKWHLVMVVAAAQEFLYLIPEADRDRVIAACWMHDLIEDTTVNYNEILRVVHDVLCAEIVYAVTLEKGRNRAERANAKYYTGIRTVPYAPFVKLIDRLANVKYSLENKSSQLGMYVSEHSHFINHFTDFKEYSPIILELNNYIREAKEIL